MAMTFDPFRQFERLAAGLVDPGRGPRPMPMDLYRDGNSYVLSADLPGVDPGSIDVDVDGQQLSIRAERSTHSGEGAKWIVREREAGSYLRQFTLGDGLDTDGIAASYENGVLTVTIPVSERARPRKVAVTTGAGGNAQIGAHAEAQAVTG